jgi:predicted PurR-regulated permease PerM
MNKVIKVIGGILLLALLGYLLWKFSFLIVYTIIAAILSFIGHPIVRFLEKLHFKKLKIPKPLCAVLALVVLVIVFLSLFAVFVPLINSEIQTISKINLNGLSDRLEGPLKWIERQIQFYGLVPEGSTLQEVIIQKAKSLLNYSSISNVVGGIVGAAGSFMVAFFSILFIAFFFIKDEGLFGKLVLMLVPENKHKATLGVINQSKTLLTRYFVGIILELLGVMTCITIGLWIFGVKNALLLGFFGGLMNIVPYVGPIIGTIIGIMLGTTTALAYGDPNLLVIMIKILGVFMFANFIDNWILQPMIYSSSVKAHPLEIFYVIIIGGSLWGIPGMVIAVPFYTVLRIIAREFLSEFPLVRRLTKNLDENREDENSG